MTQACHISHLAVLERWAVSDVSPLSTWACKGNPAVTAGWRPVYLRFTHFRFRIGSNRVPTKRTEGRFNGYQVGEGDVRAAAVN